MSKGPEDVKIQIQRALVNINDVTGKIKQELEMINEIVKAQGHLPLTIDEANGILAKAAKKKAINIAGELLDNQNLDEDFDEFNLLGTVSMEEITQKLMAIMDN